jgi:FlaA1/EpsC-like NDP-sugar epimerase
MFVRDGDIHLFDMGDSILITDLIERLQRILGGHSNLVFTGLRDGEKLNEDLFGGIEASKTSIPNLIMSSNHKMALEQNSETIRQAISRNEQTTSSFLRMN